MRRVIRGAAIICLLLPLTACGFRQVFSNDLYGFLEGLTGVIGSSQITSDKELIGERTKEKDAYAGRYWAECRGSTGKDVVFGGGSIDSRRLYLSGYVLTESGRAVVRIRMNEDVSELETDEDGYFETELHLNAGGNYIMVSYDNFVGTVDMTVRYAGSGGIAGFFK